MATPGTSPCLTDVTEALTVAEGLATQARIDALTGLPNRLAIEEELDRIFTRAGGEQCQPTVLFVDIDNFKDVNDSLGHSAGDEAIRIAAMRLQAAVSPTHMVGRFGGDEFVIMLGPHSSHEDARDVATGVLHCRVHSPSGCRDRSWS